MNAIEPLLEEHKYRAGNTGGDGTSIKTHSTESLSGRSEEEESKGENRPNSKEQAKEENNEEEKKQENGEEKKQEKKQEKEKKGTLKRRSPPSPRSHQTSLITRQKPTTATYT